MESYAPLQRELPPFPQRETKESFFLAQSIPKHLTNLSLHRSTHFCYSKTSLKIFRPDIPDSITGRNVCSNFVIKDSFVNLNYRTEKVFYHFSTSNYRFMFQVAIKSSNIAEKNTNCPEKVIVFC